MNLARRQEVSYAGDTYLPLYLFRRCDVYPAGSTTQ